MPNKVTAYDLKLQIINSWKNITLNTHAAPLKYLNTHNLKHIL